jgi:hypothetical protein
MSVYQHYVYDTLLRYVETNCGKFMSVYQHYRVVSRYVLQQWVKKSIFVNFGGLVINCH